MSELKQAINRSRTLLARPIGAVNENVAGESSRSIWKPLETLRRSSLKAIDNQYMMKYGADTLDNIVETLEFAVQKVAALHPAAVEILTLP
jgi:hypothetical protein